MIGSPAYLHHFVNKIAGSHEVALVIREVTPLRNSLVKNLRSGKFFSSIQSVATGYWKRSKIQTEYDDELGAGWRDLSDKFPVFTTRDINSDAVKKELEKLRPDIVLVHGTTLIRNHVLAGVPLVLNLHWGLSPYYKGSYCTQWALINHDPLNIGYTIHRLSSKIDAGDILTQGRVEVVPSDTVSRINMRLTRKGTEAMIDVITRIKNGETPLFQKQDNSKGRLYLVKHWTHLQQRVIMKLENSDTIRSMLNKPADQPHPLVKW